MRSIGNKLFKFLTSKRLAIYLIGLITLISIIGMIIPQGDNFAKSKAYLWNVMLIKKNIEFFNLNNIFSSYLFLLIILTFLINLLACTIKQIYYNIKYRDRLKDKVRKIGTVFFHISLITIVVGALLTFEYSLHGYMVVGTGQVLRDAKENYTYLEKSKFLDDNYGRFSVKLVKLNRHFKGDKLDYSSDSLEVNINGTPYRVEESKGQPFSVGNLSIYHHDSGFAPQLEVKKNGHVLFNSYVIFFTHSMENADQYYLPKGGVPNSDIEWGGNFYPDAGFNKNGIYNKSNVERNQVIKLNITNNGKNHEIIIKKGENKNLGDYEISFPSYTYWSGLDIVYDPGKNIVLFGSFLTALSLILMYIPFPWYSKKDSSTLD